MVVATGRHSLLSSITVLGHVPGHAHPPAVPAEELPVRQSSGFGDHHHPPGDLRLRQPEHLRLTVNARRPNGGKRSHGGGSDGHHCALGLGVGLGANHGDAAAPSSQRRTSRQASAAASDRLSPASDSAATRARSNFPLSAACSGVSMPRPRRRGWMAVSRITASMSLVSAPDWRWGLASRLPHPFSEARTPGSRQGDSSFAHSWAFEMALVARCRVAILAPNPARAAR